MPVSSESSRNLLDFLNDLEEKVMWQRNNGQAREELQIKFTGYLIQAVKFIQQVMGHADFSTTMDIYTHITQESMKEKAEVIKDDLVLM